MRLPSGKTITFPLYWGLHPTKRLVWFEDRKETEKQQQPTNHKNCHSMVTSSVRKKQQTERWKIAIQSSLLTDCTARASDCGVA